ncbi:MAG: peptide deformylase [Firmicutes bacterium]|nr:peptide deformylase [Bacillota bacterium]
MAVRPIIELGNPLLRQPSRPVKREELPEINDLVLDMYDTLLDFRQNNGFGRGIAAPQVGVSKRVVAITNKGQPLVLINPRIIKKSPEQFEVWDACFSYPGIWFKVSRHREVTVEYRDLDWQSRITEADGSMAELFQHEIEHLDGRLAIDLVADLSTLCTTGEYFSRYWEPEEE